jgi:translation initiation factor 2 subunit beta (aeIF-2b)
MQNYKDLLDRAFQNMPSGETKAERFVIPQAKVSIEGKTTVLENFKEITDVLNREKAHLLKYLSRELGTAGRSDDDRAIFQGKFFSEQINDLIKDILMNLLYAPSAVGQTRVSFELEGS